MARPTTISIYRWSIVIFAGLAWLSIGCSPQTLTMFMLPFSDNNKAPECSKLIKSSKEATLVVLSNFSAPQFRDEYRPADNELAESVAEGLRKRCESNSHKLKIIPQVEVRNYYLQRLSEDGDASPAAIGKKFKADFVLDLTIEQFSLYQKDFTPKSFRGTARVNVRLLDMAAKEDLPFKTYYNVDYTPHRGIPMEVGNRNPAEFRQPFIRKMGQEISRLFVEYSPDELKEWE
jgi:hypothetical protein